VTKKKCNCDSKGYKVFHFFLHNLDRSLFTLNDDFSLMPPYEMYFLPPNVKDFIRIGAKIKLKLQKSLCPSADNI
jgi:hypothetical protein